MAKASGMEAFAIFQIHRMLMIKQNLVNLV